MELTEQLQLLQGFLQCGTQIALWQYDACGTLLYSNHPQNDLLSVAFAVFGCQERMMKHAQTYDTPILLGDALGLAWGAAFEKQDGQLLRAYVLGPVFLSSVTLSQVEEGMRRYRAAETSIAWKIRLLNNVPQITVCNMNLLSHYLLMLHFCITDQKLDISDLNISSLQVTHDGQAQSSKPDRYKVYSAEQTMLQMVRNGDLNYKDALNHSINTSSGADITGADPLRGGKTAGTIFCTLVSRAAIDGGLTPEEAYSLNDAYLQAIENAATFDDLVSLPLTMYDDFVRRVHRCRTNPHVSSTIHKCIDYIEQHLDQRVRAEDLARLIGYSEYYVTRRFKEETGYFINDYIKFVKIERAKILLGDESLTIPLIAERLGFGTRSYFGQVFKEVTGQTPASFRAALLGK